MTFDPAESQPLARLVDCAPMASPVSSMLLSSTKQPAVQVYLSLRPKNSVELAAKESTCLTIIDGENVLAIPPKSSHAARKKHSKFVFSKIFSPETTQKTVFRDAVLPTIADFLTMYCSQTMFSLSLTCPVL